MQGSKSFKESLLKHMLVGRQVGGDGKAAAKSMSLLERKEAVKVSADAAMAMARGGGTAWSRTLMAGLCKRVNHRHVLATCRQCHGPTSRILKSRRSRRRRPPAQGGGRCLARTIVGKRVDALRSLVPGGTAVDDDLSFLCETIDYVVALRAQVDVMRRLADAVGLSGGS